MPHLYIRPKSLSLLDLLSVPLFSPLTFPNRILVPSSSPITLLQGVSEGFYSLLSYSPSAPICPSWTEEAPTPHTRILPASFDSLVASLGRSSRCQSPQRKVGVLTVCCQHAAGVQPPVTVYVLIVLKGTNAENLQQFKVYNVVLLFFFLFFFDWGQHSLLLLAVRSSITLWLACQLVHRNPQSDFESGIVLLMRACFYHPWYKRRFEAYKQIVLLQSLAYWIGLDWFDWRKTRW